MSVYGGFATRLQETQYSGLICRLISLLEKRIVAALRNDLFDSDQWILNFSGVYKAMRKMEVQKYQQPKFSVYCKDLAQAYNAYTRVMTRDESSSSSYMSSNGREWDLYMRQVEAMLIEESKIPRISACTPDESLLKPMLRPSNFRNAENSSPQTSLHSRGRPLSIRTPRARQDSTEWNGHPRSVAYTRIDECSDGGHSARKRRKGKKNRLADVYQDRGYTRLLAELRTCHTLINWGV